MTINNNFIAFLKTRIGQSRATIVELPTVCYDADIYVCQ